MGSCYWSSLVPFFKEFLCGVQVKQRMTLWGPSEINNYGVWSIDPLCKVPHKDAFVLAQACTKLFDLKAMAANCRDLMLLSSGASL